jgi:hypothetical protein
VSFGLFTITCGALVALHADRLAHRRRHAVMTELLRALSCNCRSAFTAASIPAG